jgi:DNA-binding NtrC family response regulator
VQARACQTTDSGEKVAYPSLDEHFLLTTLSSEMQPVQRLISEIAPTEIPVLVVGESGVGKEVVALQIHGLSNSRGFPFVKLSCAAFCGESFRAQMRDFEKGQDGKNGKSPGTLFFDEISELDADCQRHLLHLFPEGNGVPGNQSLRGRIVSCTTRELESEVSSGRFRRELFYRLNGVCLKLPPLRRRREDIPLLAQFFLRRYSRLFHRAEMSLSDRTIRMLVDYSWPGNIRELENVIKKMVALENEELPLSDLSLRNSAPAPSGSSLMTPSLKAAARAASQQAERELILQTLTRTHWNRKKAAQVLQISYKSLLYKLKQIQVPDSEEV